MKPQNTIKLFALVSASALIVGCGQGSYADESNRSQVPEGTRLNVTLDRDLSSDLCRPGEAFTMTLSDDVVLVGQTIIPSGTIVEGVVVDSERAGESAVGKLQIDAVALHIGDDSIPIEARILTPNLSASYREEIEALGDLGASESSSGAAASNIQFPASTKLIVELERPVSVPGPPPTN